MEDIILENSKYGDEFLLIFQDFNSDIKFELEENDLKNIRNKINEILEE